LGPVNLGPGSQPIDVAFTNLGKEVVITTCTPDVQSFGVTRIRIEDGAINNFPLKDIQHAPLLSSDGNWVAYDVGGAVALISSYGDGQVPKIPGALLCFGTTSLLTERTEVDGPVIYTHSLDLNAPFNDLPWKQKIAPPPPVVCSDDTIVYSGEKGLFAHPFQSFDPGASPQPISARTSVEFSPYGISSPAVVFSRDGGGMALMSYTEVELSSFAIKHVTQLWKKPVVYMDWQLKKYLPTATAVAFGPRGDVVTGDDRGLITVSRDIDLRQIGNSLIHRLPAQALKPFNGNWVPFPEESSLLHESGVGRRSPDNRWEVRIDHGVSVIDVATSVEILHVDLGIGDWSEVAFSRDGKLIAFQGGSRIQVWSLDAQYYIDSLCHALRRIPHDITWDSKRFRNICGL
jgi:hypothetical protein